MAKNKCPICQLTFDRTKCEFVHLKNRYYHKVCYEQMEAERTEEEKSKEELERYIMAMFNTTFINARIRQQIKRMREQFNYSYTGILKSLIYFYDIRKNPIEKANGGIGIVPYVYEDARKYYYNLYLAQMKNENKVVSECVVKGKEIRMKPPVRKPRTRKLFDLGEE